jgi:hypothetical protein
MNACCSAFHIRPHVIPNTRRALLYAGDGREKFQLSGVRQRALQSGEHDENDRHPDSFAPRRRLELCRALADQEVEVVFEDVEEQEHDEGHNDTASTFIPYPESRHFFCVSKCRTRPANTRRLAEKN